MKRLILFSNPTKEIKQKIVPLLFPAEMPRKVFAYMPCEGVPKNLKYMLFTLEWQALAKKHQAEFVLIDNAAANITEEREKLKRANILFITGGNPCILLRNLRQSGLDQAINEFTHQDHYILAGYSAGAMILTPSVELAAFDSNDNEEVHLADFRALNFVEYEVAPHYTRVYQETLDAYRKTRSHEVKPLADNEFIVVER